MFHEYNFDDGYFSNNSAGYHNFNKSGVYDVKLSVGSDKNCFSSVIKQVEVYKLPKVSLDVNNFCVKTPTKFFSYSNLDDSEITSYLWHFGDSNGFSTYKNPYYIYSVAGNYNVSLQILDQKGCENSAVRKIAVYDLPKISLSSLSEVCVGEEFFIVDSSYVENSSLTNWKWDFGDGTIKSGKKVSHIYEFSGIYDVSLSLISNKGCLSDTLFPNLVSVNSRPKANFNASSLNVSELASEISFFNTSEEGMLLNWNFGNGMISSEESEKINFNSPGFYDVSLVVTNEFGCSDEITKRINVFPEYSVYIPNSFSPNGDGINDFFTVSGKEVSFFNMIIYNRFGEVVFESESLSHLWDGKDSLGSEVVSGTYIYSVTAYDLNNRRWDYNGEVNLFR